MMDNLFVSHINSQNQISQSDTRYSLIIICALTIISILISIERKKYKMINSSKFFHFETNNQIRGLAILVLIFGHFALSCIEHKQYFEYAASWAVVIFILTSSLAISKKYGINKLHKDFIVKRLRRLLFPLWITLILIYCLDYIILNRSYSPIIVISNFFGIISSNFPSYYCMVYHLYYVYLFYILCFVSHLD